MIKWPKERKLDPDYSGEYWQECKGFNEGVRACKQSLNQVSEVDRIGLRNFMVKKDYPDLSYLEMADAIMKEYILVKREEII